METGDGRWGRARLAVACCLKTGRYRAGIVAATEDVTQRGPALAVVLRAVERGHGTARTSKPQPLWELRCCEVPSLRVSPWRWFRRPRRAGAGPRTDRPRRWALPASVRGVRTRPPRFGYEQRHGWGRERGLAGPTLLGPSSRLGPFARRVLAGQQACGSQDSRVVAGNHVNADAGEGARLDGIVRVRGHHQ